jgi:hypothetical protein
MQSFFSAFSAKAKKTSAERKYFWLEFYDIANHIKEYRFPFPLYLY